MRWATVVAFALLAAGCNDLRDYRGSWSGPRVGAAEVVRLGVESSARATLTVDAIDEYGFAGTLSITGLVDAAAITSVEGAEADVLAGITFSGAPLRTYLAFVPAADGNGDVFAVIALFDHERIEVRILRGGPVPLYGIFALTSTEVSP